MNVPVPERRPESTPMNEPGNRFTKDGSSGTGADLSAAGPATARSGKARDVGRGLAVLTLLIAGAFFARRGSTPTPRPSLAGQARTITLTGSATPKEVTALAERLCSALHRAPAERVGACCGRSGGEFFYDECVSEVVATLKA